MSASKIFAISLWTVSTVAAYGVDLKTATLHEWNEYVRAADGRMRERAAGVSPYLWTDESPVRKARVLQGEIVVAPVERHGTQSVAGGLIHDWVGAAFIPNATIADLFRVVHDYDRYKEYFAPVVAESKTIAATDTDQEFSMVWQRHILFINAAMQGRYQAHDVTVDARHGFNIASSAEVREIEEYGHAGQRLLPPDTGNGFIWRMHSISRFEERDGGVYLEIEAIALTRDIPAALHFMVSPVVNRLSVNSLTETLRQTRDAVKSLRTVVAARSFPR